MAALDPKPGERVLDCCAAPGGKALFIAERMRGEVCLAIAMRSLLLRWKQRRIPAACLQSYSRALIDLPLHPVLLQGEIVAMDINGRRLKALRNSVKDRGLTNVRVVESDLR